MKVKIEIECDDEQEVLSHLNVIRKQIKRAFRKHLKKDPEYMEHPEFLLEDNNCYGLHSVIVTEDLEGYEFIPSYHEQHQ